MFYFENVRFIEPVVCALLRVEQLRHVVLSGFQLIHDQSTSFDFVDIKPSESYEIRWILQSLKHCNKMQILICDTDCFLIVSTCNTQNYFVLSSLVVPPKACFSPIYENLVILIAATVLQLYCKSSVGLYSLARRPYPYISR